MCTSRPPIVSQYMWPELDQTERVCNNGISHPIYACNGNVSYTLPLDMYPPVNGVHPQIRMSWYPQFDARDPVMRNYIEQMQEDRRLGRIEGFYMG